MFAAFSIGEFGGGLLPLPRHVETVNRRWTSSPIYTQPELEIVGVGHGAGERDIGRMVHQTHVAKLAGNVT